MAQKNTTHSVKIETKEVVYIKPSTPTPTSILSLSSIDNDPGNNCFTQVIFVYQSPNHNSTNTVKLDPANLIKEALSKALSYYYPLAGKLVIHTDGKPRINCNSEGVPFIEANCNCDLSSLHYLDGEGFEMGKHFAENFPSHDEFGNQYLLVMNVTKFLCGGFTLVMSQSHAISDGSGASQFLQAVAELASGRTEPSVKPVWERERLVGTFTSKPMQNPMDKISLAVSPFLPTKDFSHQCFKVSNESIERLKMNLMKENANKEITKKKGFTTFETLAAYIWRSRARALKLNYDGETILIIIVDIKPHLLDPLPSGYYGNTIVEPCVVSTVRELNERPLVEIVKLIREKINDGFSSDYIRHMIDSIETKPMMFDYESGAIVTLVDWRHLGLLENVDFGWKEPVNMVSVPCDINESLATNILLPPNNKLDPSKNEGARVDAFLPSVAMPRFKQEMEALETIHIA